MLEDYIATQEDLHTIEEGISYVWKPELEYIFKDKSKIEDTLIISYDSKNIYVFGRKKDFKKTPHQTKITKDELRGWCAGLHFEGLKSYLADITTGTTNSPPIISGPLITPMLETQKQLDRLSNAYTTKESYLATIVHEFGHIYFDSFGLQFFPDPKDSQLYINKALEMFEGNDTLKIENVEIRLPLDHTLSEVFAFCTDYSAASIFWPQHKQDIDRMQAADIKRYVGKKSKDDLQNNDTYLPKDPHLMAAIVGKILLNKYPETWPIKLIQFSTLPLSN